MCVEMMQHQVMPKVTQKTSGKRGKPVSSSDSDSNTQSERPRKSGGKGKASNDQSSVCTSSQRNGSRKTTAVDRNHDVESDDENEIPTTPATSESASTQRAVSAQSEKLFMAMSAQDRERIAIDIVHYLLTADYKKHPIKQSDIKKHALREHSRAFNSLFRVATEKLRNVYGIKVVETEVGKQKANMLVNLLDNKYDAAHQTWSPEDNSIMGLIMTILSVIFMKGNVLSEEDLYDLLTRLGITLDRPDDTFGEVKHLIMTDFVRQGYLELEREQGSDPPVHWFRWGPRAKAETSKQHAMDFICQVFGDEPAQRWAAQLHDIEQSRAAADSEADAS